MQESRAIFQGEPKRLLWLHGPTCLEEAILRFECDRKALNRMLNIAVGTVHRLGPDMGEPGFSWSRELLSYTDGDQCGKLETWAAKYVCLGWLASALVLEEDRWRRHNSQKTAGLYMLSDKDFPRNTGHNYRFWTYQPGNPRYFMPHIETKKKTS